MDNYYGTPESLEAKVLYERLRDYYEPSDFVTVQNIDSIPVRYQFMDPKNEQFVQNAPYNGETYHTAPPTVIVLQPGQTKLCPAFEADAMIVTLVKQITTRSTQSEIDAGQRVKGFAANWSDPQTQSTLLGKIIVSKKDLVEEYNQALQPNVDKDLGLDEPVRIGRPRKVQG